MFINNIPILCHNTHKKQSFLLCKLWRKEIWEDSTRVVLGEILDHEKCIKQLALNVAKNVKFHSSLRKADLFIAENALEIREVINSKDS